MPEPGTAPGGALLGRGKSKLRFRDGVARRARRWQEKYAVGSQVSILLREPDSATRTLLEAEKQANARGFLPKSPASQRGDSVAALGRKLGEDFLRKEIL